MRFSDRQSVLIAVFLCGLCNVHVSGLSQPKRWGHQSTTMSARRQQKQQHQHQRHAAASPSGVMARWEESLLSRRSTKLHGLFGSQTTFVDEDDNVESSVFRSHQQLNNRHSASDWFYNMRSMPQSRVLREVRGPVLAVAGWSFVVSMIHQALLVSSTLQPLAMKMSIPATAHGFLVSALGLLLVFRTNSAYQRFYEGRKIWENILSISRNLSRMMHLYSDEIGDSRKSRILKLVAAYPYLLRQHVRPGCLCEPNGDSLPTKHRLLLQGPSVAAVETRHEGDKTCGGITSSDTPEPATRRHCWVDKRNLPWSLFDKRALPDLSKAQNRPLWVCDRIGRELVSIPYGPNFTSRERLSLLGQVEKLSNAIGECERIHQTAVPLNYARHSLRSLTLWLFTLPFALVKDLGLLTAPVNAVIAWLLLGVYQIGYSIEDPFQGTLRLSILCDAIRRDVLGDRSDEYRRTSYGSNVASSPDDALIDSNLFQGQDLFRDIQLWNTGVASMVGTK